MEYEDIIINTDEIDHHMNLFDECLINIMVNIGIYIFSMC